MNNLEETLWKDYKEVSDLITILKDGDETKKNLLLEERDKIRNELLKLELSKNEKSLKEKEINAENHRELIRNRVTVATFTVSTMLSLYAIARTFRFDESSTITSTLGRNILNGIIPKMFKR